MQRVHTFRLTQTAIIGVLSLFLVACGDKAAQQAAPQAVPVKVGTAEQRSIAESHEYTGRFEASKRVALRARVSGYLQSVNFEDGQIVEEGQVLFVIDQRQFQIAVNAAQARFNLAENEFMRAKKLRKSKAISVEDFETREQQMQVAKASLDEAKLNLDFTEIKAPFAGRVGRNLVDIGSLVSANTGPLTTVLAVNPIDFYFNGSETDLLRYKRQRASGVEQTERGDPYPVSVKLQDESDFIHHGEINFLNNEVSRETGSIQVRATFDNSEDFLEPGLFGRLLLTNATPQDVLVVPQTIVGTEQTRRFVYAVDENNTVTRQYVELGAVTKDGQQIILAGIQAEDRLVMGGLHMVRPGVTVMPLPMEMPSKAMNQPQEATEATAEEATDTETSPETTPEATDEVEAAQ